MLRPTLSSSSPAATGRANACSVRSASSTAPALDVGRAPDEDGELVAAEARHDVLAAHRSARAARRRRAAARRRSRCPSVSLTPLKSSRSMTITATSPGVPGSSASRTRWLNSERLASPVSGSWWAWCWSWSCRSRSSETACSRRSYCSAALALAASVSNSARSASVKPRERPKRFASMIVPITRSSPRSTPSMPWRTPRSWR